MGDLYPHVFQPIELGSLRVRNRLFMTTHGPRLSRGRYLDYLEARAQGGVGLIGLPAGFGVGDAPTGPGRFVPDYAGDFDAVGPDPTTPEGIAYHDDRVIPMLSAQADVIHRAGALCVGQLHHAGASNSNDNLQPVVGPSDVPDEYRRSVPHPLTQSGIERVMDSFAHGARRVQAAGLDGVELHAAHGYLLQQFLSPHSNRRSDRYGGSLANRMRLLLEIVQSIRRTLGTAFPIGVRLSAPEPFPGGLGLAEVVEVARSLEAAGVTYLNVSGGTFTGLKRGLGPAYVASSYQPPAPNVAAARAIRSAVDVPVVVGGRIPSIELADELIARGDADMVGMVRALIADPELPRKARAGAVRRITPCIGGNECHYPGRPLVCAVNPSAGRERELTLVPVAAPKRVLVVGGGPAGLSAAIAASERGHAVVLCERDAELGGLIRSLSRDPAQPELRSYLDRIVGRTRDSAVDVRLATPVDASLVATLAPECVVIATGSRPYRPKVPGIDDARVKTALDVFDGREPLGERVVVVGGIDDYLAPLKVADVLSARGADVELISENFGIGQGVEPATLYALTKRLLGRGVRLSTLTRLERIGPGDIELCNVFTGARHTIAHFDHVVLACGSRSDAALAGALKGRVPELHVIGDSLAPRRLLHATLEGARVGGLI